MKNFYKTIRNNIRSPDVEMNIKIDLVMKFTINENGKIDDIEFLESNDPIGLFENEIIRVLSRFPDFEPGIFEGETVSVSYAFPMSFDLTSN